MNVPHSHLHVAPAEHRRQLERENAALLAEIETLLADAERYRWLRNQRLSGSYCFAQTMGWKIELLSCDQVDAAIDAALKEKT